MASLSFSRAARALVCRLAPQPSQSEALWTNVLRERALQRLARKEQQQLVELLVVFVVVVEREHHLDDLTHLGHLRGRVG